MKFDDSYNDRDKFIYTYGYNTGYVVATERLMSLFTDYLKEREKISKSVEAKKA